MYPTDPSPPVNPISAAWNTVARFDDYEAAQRAVDRLSDDGFPVEKLDIIGTDLRTIERVTGRLTTVRAAGAGAISGLWVGVLFGLLLGLFTNGNAWFAVILVGARPRRGLGRHLGCGRPRGHARPARLQFRPYAGRQPL